MESKMLIIFNVSCVQCAHSTRITFSRTATAKRWWWWRRKQRLTVITVAKNVCSVQCFDMHGLLITPKRSSVMWSDTKYGVSRCLHSGLWRNDGNIVSFILFLSVSTKALFVGEQSKRQNESVLQKSKESGRRIMMFNIFYHPLKPHGRHTTHIHGEK